MLVARRAQKEAVLREQQALGGIEAYQQASMYGARSSHFVCARWVEPLLRQHMDVATTPDGVASVDETQGGARGAVATATGRRARLLDVGAIDNQYLPYDWVDAVPIDLRAQHASVVEADFFDYAAALIAKNDGAAAAPDRLFDAVVLSLVLNFQGDPRKRGDMLALASDGRLLRPGGLVFVALPAAALDRSRYCDEGTLVRTCGVLGLDVVARQRSAKLALLALRRRRRREEDATAGADAAVPPYPYHVASGSFVYPVEMSRPPAKPGKDRNNFAIMLKSTTRQSSLQTKDGRSGT